MNAIFNIYQRRYIWNLISFLHQVMLLERRCESSVSLYIITCWETILDMHSDAWKMILKYITFTSSSCCDVLSSSWLKFLILAELSSCLCSKIHLISVSMKQSSYNMMIFTNLNYISSYCKYIDLLHFLQTVVDTVIINHLHIFADH